MPPGLTLNPSTGVISGTPDVAGTYTFTFPVSDPYTYTPEARPGEPPSLNWP